MPSAENSPRVVFLAAPLMARSGVYRSTIDLVNEARSIGLEWSAVIGMRPEASGSSLADAHVDEVQVVTHGAKVFKELADLFENHEYVRNADVVITMITQSDIAFARTGIRPRVEWVAWTRGLPWPARGEESAPRRLVTFALESFALRRADRVWATTPVLAREVSRARKPELVRAGIPHSVATWSPSLLERGTGNLTWAGRLKVDKNPVLAARIGKALGRKVVFYGEGPLEEELRSFGPETAELRSWVAPGELWAGASIYLGTSIREAFGRSVVEAAMAGVPLVLHEEYGAAPLLFTDPDLKRMCVLPLNDFESWTATVRRLLNDEEFARRVSDHVRTNAQMLTISASVRAVVSALAE